MEKFARNGLIINAQEYKKWRTHLTNPLSGAGRGVSEWLFSNYKDMMEQLRAADDVVRAIALGKDSAIDISVRDAIVESKKALKENRLIDALYYAAVVNVIAQEILAGSSDVVKTLRSALYRQYGKQYNPQAMDYMEVLRGHQASQQKAAEIISDNCVEIKKEAQFLQGMYRSLFGDPLQKSWQNEIKKFRGPVENAVNKAEQFATNMLAIFDRMGMARTKGMIGDWIAGLDEIAKLQPQYGNDVLKAFTAIQPIIDVAKQNEQDERVQTLGRDVSGKALADLMLDMVHRHQEQKKQPTVPQSSVESGGVGAPAGKAVPGVPVSQSRESILEDDYFPPPDEPAETKRPFNKSEPLPGPGRPPKKVQETFGVDPNQLYSYLKTKGKSEEEMREAFKMVGLDYDSVKKEPVVENTTSEPTTEQEENQPFDLTTRKYLDEIDQMGQLQILNVIDVLEAAVENKGENETVQDSDGNIVGSVEDGVVSVEGIEIPVEEATTVLEKLKTEEPPAIAAEKEPNLLPGKPEEPKKEEPTKATEIKEVQPNVSPKEVKKDVGSDRIIIFSNIKRADEKKAIETLSKSLGKPVNVMTASDRRVKKDYPNAEYYVLGIDPEEGENIFPKEAFDLLQKKLTKDTKAKLREIFKIVKNKTPKEEPVAKVEPPKKEEPSKEEPVAKVEPKKVEPIKAPKKEEVPKNDAWDEAKVLEPGKAQYENLIATVNIENIDNFTKTSQSNIVAKDADVVVIWVRGQFTGAELMSASAAFQSYFGKETILTADGGIANSALEKADRKNKSVAAYVWSREDLRSVMNFSKVETQTSITATVDNAVLKLANRRFYNRLQKAAELNDPYLMAQMMLQYSEVIEDKDEELSCQLLAKAQELLDE